MASPGLFFFLSRRSLFGVRARSRYSRDAYELRQNGRFIHLTRQGLRPGEVRPAQLQVPGFFCSNAAQVGASLFFPSARENWRKFVRRGPREIARRYKTCRFVQLVPVFITRLVGCTLASRYAPPAASRRSCPSLYPCGHTLRAARRFAARAPCPPARRRAQQSAGSILFPYFDKSIEAAPSFIFGCQFYKTVGILYNSHLFSLGRPCRPLFGANYIAAFRPRRASKRGRFFKDGASRTPPL